MKNFLIVLSFLVSLNSIAQEVTFNYKEACFWNSDKEIFDDCIEDNITSSYVLDADSGKIYFNEFGQDFTLTYHKVIDKGNVSEYIVSEVIGEEFVVTISKDKSYLKIIYVNVGIKTSMIYKNN